MYKTKKQPLKLSLQGHNIYSLFLAVGNQAVAAVFSLVDNGEGIFILLILEYEELVVKKIHLENCLFNGHGLDGKALGAHYFEFRFFLGLDGNHGGKILIKGAFADTLFKTGLVLANLTLNGSNGRVDGGEHIAGALADAEEHTVGLYGKLNDAAVLFYGKGNVSGGLVLEKTVQFANFLLGILLDAVADIDLLFGVNELHK